MRSSSIALLTVALAVALMACTPARITRLQQPSADSTPGRVVVHRKGALNAGGVSAVLGIDDSDLVVLRSGTYVELSLDPGEHDFFIRSTQADRPFHRPVAVAAASTTCLRVPPNPNNWMKALFFTLGYYFGNTFLLEAIPCPEPSFYSAYKKVSIMYEAP